MQSTHNTATCSLYGDGLVQMILYVPGGGGTASSTPSPLISSTVWTVAKCRSDSSHPIIVVARKHYITAAKVRLCCWNLSFSHRPFLASPIPFPLSLSFLFCSPQVSHPALSFFLTYGAARPLLQPCLSFTFISLTCDLFILTVLHL